MAIALGLAWSGASAAELHWSPNGVPPPGDGGTGNWNITSLLWYNENTDSFQAWDNSTLDNAVFGGTAGVVTLTSSVTAQGLAFNESGYSLTTGNRTLTLAGTSPTISVVGDGIAIIDVVIAGGDGLTHVGPGTTILTRNSNNFDGTTTISGGTLQLGDGGGAGSVAGNIDIGTAGTLVFDRNTNTVTYDGAITGDGALIKNNDNTLRLTGNGNTFSGLATINAGTLRIGNNANGSFAGDILNHSALIFNRTDDDVMVYGGTIDGGGTVTKTGNGTVAFTGNNIYAGETAIDNGTLQGGIANAFSSASAHTVSGSGTLDLGGFNQTIASLAGNGSVTGNAMLTAGGNNESTTFSGVIEGVTTSFTKTGTGTLIFSGNNTYSGTTTISDGTLQLGNDTNAGSVAGNIDIATDGTLVINRRNTMEYGGVISGDGALTKDNTNILRLTGDSTFTGTATINAGTLQIGNGGATGSIGGDIVNNSALVFDRSGALSYGGVISGGGTLTKTGSGTLTLTGTNTYSGNTAINNGAIAVSTDSNLGGASSGLIFGGGTLQFLEDFASDRAITLNSGAGGTFDTNGHAATLGGTIAGSRPLTKIGAGTLTLTGDNTYTNSTTISAGTLQIGNGGTSGNVIGDVAIADNAALVFNRADTLTYAGTLSGAGTLTQAGTGTTILTRNNNSLIGTTTISDGTLQIGAGGASATTGSVGGNILNNSALVFDRSSNVTYAGVISGTGTLTKNNTNTLTLTGDNIYEGTTTINSGRLELGNNSTTGSIAGDIILMSNTTLQFDRSNAVTYGGVISGDGAVIKSRADTLTLTGNNVYTGGTAIDNGTLQGGTTNAFSSASTHTVSGTLDLGGFNQAIGSLAGNGSVTNAGATNAVLTAGGNNASTTFSGVIGNGAGTTGLTKIGTGTLTLSGNNSYAGTTTISSGTLQIGAGGGGGSIASVNVVNNSALVFNRSNATSYAGVISGSGTLTKNGGGTLTLTGDNVFTGLTTINTGTLQIGNGGTTGSIVSDVVNDNALIFNRSNALTYGRAISGTGTLTKTGAGTLTLTGTNTFNGTTAVNAGTLLVNGNNANSAVTVSNGATLGGTGTVSTTTIGNGATLSPGNSVGTFTVNDNLTFNNSGNYLVEFEPPAANDLTNVAGTAFLNGTVTAVVAPGSYTAGSYLILSATGGVNGTFYTLAVQGSFGMGAKLTYDPNNVFLRLGEVGWEGGTSTDWFTAANWDSDTVPTANDTTIIDRVTPNPTVIDGTIAPAAESGEIRIGNSATGVGHLTIQNGGALQSNGDALVGHNGGTGEVVVTGANSAWTVTGALWLGGKLGAGNGRLTIGNGATVSVGNGGGTVHGSGNEAILSIEGGILNAARVALSGTTSVFFNHGLENYVFAPRITGTGKTVFVGGGGATIFTADNTYTGPTQISDATLQLGDGGTSGAITGDVEFVAGQGGALVFNRSDILTYGGTISGDGDVVQIGTGTTILTGNHTYTGSTTVNAGILVVDGSIANSMVMVNGSGMLRGNGQLGAIHVRSGGIVRPGDSIGTLVVNRNFTLNPGAIYEVEVNAAGEGDKVIVSGMVNLTGSTLHVLAENGDYKPRTEYVIVENDGADAVQGTFAEITSSLAFLTPTVIYDGATGNDVVLFLTRNDSDFCAVARTRNECNVARALDELPIESPLYLAVLQQSAGGARQAFDALSGEIHATLPGVLAGDSRYVREAVLGRLVQAAYTNRAGQIAALGANGPQVASLSTGRALDEEAMALGYGEGKSLAAPPPGDTPGVAFWTRGYGTWGELDGDGNAASADRDLGGVMSGVDAQLAGTWRVGLAAGGAWSNVSVDARRSRAEVESFNLAAYAGGMAGPLALRGGGAWSWSDIDTSRAVAFPGFFERQESSYDADTGQIFAEIAYPLAAGRVAVEPFAGLAYVGVETDRFRERGGALSRLNGDGDDEDIGYATLGLRAATVVHVASLTVVPKISAAWQHAFDDVTPAASLAFVPSGIGFGIDGVPLAEDSVLIEAGLDLALSPTATLGVSYTGQFADDLADNGIKGRLTWLF